MTRFFERESTKAFLLAVIFLGVIILVIGAAFYVIYSIQIEQNPAYQIQTNEVQIPADVAQTLVGATSDLRDLVRTREVGLILVGVGIVVLALGWLGREYASFRTEKKK